MKSFSHAEMIGDEGCAAIATTVRMSNPDLT